MNVTFDEINSQDNVPKSSDEFFAINDPRIDDVEELERPPAQMIRRKRDRAPCSVLCQQARRERIPRWRLRRYRNTAFDSDDYFNNAQGMPP